MRLFPIVFTFFLQTAAYAQDDVIIQPAEKVQRFYTLVKTSHPWVEQRRLQQELLTLFRQAAQWGLAAKDYPVAYLDSLYARLLPLRSREDSIVADTRITYAAIGFFRTIATGQDKPPVAYEGLPYVPDCLDVTGLLALSVGSGMLSQLPAALEPSTDDYKALSLMLRELLAIRNNTDSNTNSQTAVVAWLRAAGVIPYALHEPDPVKLRFLLSGRISELNEALNTIRWARCLQQGACILVNIPSASLHYYVHGKLVLQSRVVVGKRSTPTGTLSSAVNEVVLYPYWTVPSKIASRELLPMIKRNAAFLNDNGYQVISGGKIINPASVKWDKYNASYFPFTLRQSTGCDNSLGIIKLSFNSPYGIYLHDTPWKSLFNLPARHLSHGCVRVERVTELANLVLEDDSITLKEVLQKGDSLNNQPTLLRLAQPVPVVVVYQTAWPDSTGTVRFYKDIYSKNYP